ncbi:MAG: hypothetical protein RL333_1569 [Pseudomonadota bacterium]|jgi:ABC-type Fe3+ transport system substrate-binding protein
MRTLSMLSESLSKPVVRGGLFLIAVILILAGPFLLRPNDHANLMSGNRRLVIVSPHDQRVRSEMGGAFMRYWKQKTGETVDIDWRIPGGSSEIFMLLKSEYLAAFRQMIEAEGTSWAPEMAAAFVGSGASAKGSPTAEKARSQFLESKVGIGIDVLFGGGAGDFQQLADAGYLVAGDVDQGTGIASIRQFHPDWFSDAILPESFAGERYRDAKDRWIGVVLASFGIIYNRDVYRELGNLPAPIEWNDLASPQLVGHLALADPTKSGSVAKAFELMVQQQMLESHRRRVALGDLNAEAHAIEEGWLSGLRLIQRLSGNARYFTDSAGKIGLEVARGDAAAGMAIDTYGRTLRDYVRNDQGDSRIGYVSPKNGTSLSVDPVALLRGAPDPKLATAFIEFLLSPEGQKIWSMRPGLPQGPTNFSLRRFPVRRDLYTEEQKRLSIDSGADPYAEVTGFTYHPEWTQVLFPALRFVIRVICVDPHEELARAWHAVVRGGMQPDALRAFHDLDGLTLIEVREQLLPVLKQRDKTREMALARQMGDQFRRRYLEAERRAMGERTP